MNSAANQPDKRRNAANRTAPHGEFHDARKIWSRIKHGIFGRYLSLLLGKVGRLAEHVYCVDGFAGQGRYASGEEGSPLIAAKVAAEPVQKSRRDVLRCINVEPDSDTFSNLAEATAAYAEQGIVTNLPGTFEENLPTVLKKIQNNPTLFFIDPFGTEGAEISTLQTIAKRNGKTEVLVRYDDTRVKRLIAWAKNHRDAFDESHRKTAQAFHARVAQLTTDDAVERFLRDEPNAREELIRGYVAEVKRRKIFRFGIYYPVRNPATGGHHYYLAHFCNHLDGYCHMANFMAKVERTLAGLSAKGGELFGNASGQMELMEIRREFADRAEDDAVKRITAQLPHIFRDRKFRNRNVQNREIFAAIVDQFGYSTTRKEWLKALRALQDAGTLKMDGSEDSSYTFISGA
jgi:three-Cys-motif partner protein